MSNINRKENTTLLREIYRKCAKCGKTRSEDQTVTYHRFPDPGTTNITKARAWAVFCWPNDDWSSTEALYNLHAKHKVLCGRHFESDQFYDSARQKLSRFAVPKEPEIEQLLNKENVFVNILNSYLQNIEETVESRNRKLIESFSQIEQYYLLFSSKNPLAIPTSKSSALGKTCEIWAKYCFPDKPWSSVDFQSKLYLEHRMLCNKHFKVSEFLNVAEKKLCKHAAPDIPYEEYSKSQNSPSTAKRKLGEVGDGSTFNVELEPEVNKFVDHGLIEDDIDNSGDIEFIDETRFETDAVHVNFKCNICEGDIVGFRYSCLQCLDWDMCVACEARGAHSMHYVLRIPAPTSLVDNNEVIAALREQIHHLLQLSKEIKTEIYVKGEGGVDELSNFDEFDANLMDPILVTNDRIVPLLNNEDNISVENNTELEETEAVQSIANSESVNEIRNYLWDDSKESSKKMKIEVKSKGTDTSGLKVNERVEQIIKTVSDTHTNVIIKRRNKTNVIIKRRTYDDR